MSSCEIHLFNSLENADGGSEWRTLTLYEALKPRGQVDLWSAYKPDPILMERYPIWRLDAHGRQFPQTGTFVFIGVYHCPGTWVYQARPKRTIVVYNTFDPALFHKMLRRISANGTRKVEVVYTSELMQNSVSVPGVVQPSLIDLSRFSPRKSKLAGDARSSFTIGRLSRDYLDKHHENDPPLYRRLAAQGCAIRIMGGTCLAPRLRGVKSIILMRSCDEEADVFLRSLDCFYYRTACRYVEPLGRVVFEAMGCGLPVVCHRSGGYTEWIEHGRNGFLFETDDEAFEILLRLKNDQKLRRIMGRAARKTVEAMYSPARRTELLDFYCRP